MATNDAVRAPTSPAFGRKQSATSKRSKGTLSVLSPSRPHPMPAVSQPLLPTRQTQLQSQSQERMTFLFEIRTALVKEIQFFLRRCLPHHPCTSHRPHSLRRRARGHPDAALPATFEPKRYVATRPPEPPPIPHRPAAPLSPPHHIQALGTVPE